jgi:hypothetical protein
METAEKFETWAIVELFGHNQIAGKCSEQNIAGSNMLRVDVPETNNNPAFSRLLGSGAIYAINPVTEEVARHWAKSLRVAPLTSWDVRSYMEKNKLSLSEGQITSDMLMDSEEHE